MTGDETIKLVDFIHATWNIRPTEKERKAAYGTWSRYVGAFEYNDALEQVDRHALTSQWAPKPLDIHIPLAAPDLPTNEQAWLEAQKLVAAINNGTAVPAVHPVVAATLKGTTGKLHERSFTALYDRAKGDYLLGLFNA